MKKLAALPLCMLLLLSAMPAAAAGSFLTRRECAETLSLYADDYGGAGVYDLLRGDESGELRESEGATRIEALVMLARAFPALSSGYAASDEVFPPDVPKWARAETGGIFAAGLVTLPDGLLHPDAPVGSDELILLCRRVFARIGTNPRDDFHASVCRSFPGIGAFSSAREASRTELLALVRRHVSSPADSGDRALAALFADLLDLESRRDAGLCPVRKYLDAIDAADDLSALLAVREAFFRDTGLQLLFGFEAERDPECSRRYIPALSVSLGRYGEFAAVERQEVFLGYISSLLAMSGEDESSARGLAQAILTAERHASERGLSAGELFDAGKTNNIFSLAGIGELLPGAAAALEAAGLGKAGRIAVPDVGRVQALSEFLKSAPVSVLRAYCKYELLSASQQMLTPELRDSSLDFSDGLRGAGSARSEDALALSTLCALMPEQLSRLYADEFFSPTAAGSAESLAGEIAAAFKDNIRSLSWMSDRTKERACAKLDAIRVFAGTYGCGVDPAAALELKTFSQGGGLFESCSAIGRARWAAELSLLVGSGSAVGHMPHYSVNACYVPSENAVYLPVAILREPFFSENAPLEQNLGFLGYIVAHEIAHALDNFGSRYDESGNVSDWWSTADRRAFDSLCARAEALYDGREALPGISCSGSLTLSENIADLGAVSCITKLCLRHGGDLRSLYISAARLWCGETPAAFAQYLSKTDVHAPAKLRGGFVFSQLQEFYDAFGIDESDGMWLSPEERVGIW